MVDFAKLKTQNKKATPIEPLEIFRRLPKPPGINDLYTSQAEVLETWFQRRTQRDVVIKLHTGGGKTLVGLLMAQSTINEINEPVLYLTPTRQLMTQTLEKAKALGIAAVPYQVGESLNGDFLNGKAVMVSTYKALFNGLSKFGVRSASVSPIKVSAVILDDAHVAFSVVRASFTLEVEAEKDRARYDSLVGLFRRAFREIERLGTFDDTVQGMNNGVLEVPYWAWYDQLDAVREQLRTDAEKYSLTWPLLRDNLHVCHAIISRSKFTITPVLPFVSAFPTFAEAQRRIYMSATIADDSEIVRTFDADPKLIDNALVSRSLAGISERMILIPDLMPFNFNVRESIDKLLEWTTETKNLGAVVLVPSNDAAERWTNVAEFPKGSEKVEAQVKALQTRTTNGPVVFANRYDGIDLLGDSCRLLIMEGLPEGTSDYELLRAATLYGGASISRMLAQRIEQGIGRAARGSGDHCVVLLAGAKLASWVAKNANFRLLTGATRAQLDMGAAVSKEICDLKDMASTILKSFDRDSDWVEYHAETLAETVKQEASDSHRFDVAATERKAFDLWYAGYHEKAIDRLRNPNGLTSLDPQTRGWLLQFASYIAYDWGNSELADKLQREAYAENRNLLRPKTLPPYRPLPKPSKQAAAIASQFRGYHLRRGFLKHFEEVVSYLHAKATANQFEQSLVEFAQLIGLSSERCDNHGVGPDVLWLLPQLVGVIIEAKSRKDGKNSFTKEEHGQLLVAEQWFKKEYPGYKAVRVSVHPSNIATEAAIASGSYALTYEKLNAMIADARTLFRKLSESQLTDIEVEAECTRLLEVSSIRADRLLEHYMVPFIQR